MDWAKSEAKKAGLTNSVEGLRKVLVDIIPLIRFPIFTATEMALTVTPTRILTSDQVSTPRHQPQHSMDE